MILFLLLPSCRASCRKEKKNNNFLDVNLCQKKKNTRELKQRLRRQQRERQIVISLIRQIITLHVHHAFLYISLRLLHDYNVKLPSLKIGDCEQSGKEAEIGKINHEAKKQGRTETLQIFFQIIIPKLVLDEGNSNSVKTYLLVGLWAEFWSSGLSRLWRKTKLFQKLASVAN